MPNADTQKAALETPIETKRRGRGCLFSWQSYWIRVIIVAVAGIYLGERLDHTECWSHVRYAVYQFLQDLSWRKPYPQRTALVLIDDEEYWKGELQARVPVKRDYLARLVTAAASANAAVIALDFDLRSPSPDGNPREYPEYMGETKKLIEAITSAVKSGKKVVLTKTIHDEGDEEYVVESDIYEPLPPEWTNVRMGYHVFDDDSRILPPVIKTTTGQSIEPFALAIARADNAASLENIPDLTAELYAGFLPVGKFTKISSRELLNNDKKTELLSSKIVIISGVWHQFGYERGYAVNSYDTPVGKIPGALIHANYLEAILDSRVYTVWKGWSLRITEFLLALLIAIPFFVKKISKKWKTILITLPYLSALGLAYFSLMNFGKFFDPFIPVLSVTLHGVFEQIMHWRALAHERKTG
ncbi:MAG TPA: CHASE2 domain-containing protein [Pyrinomonadaceae bacterium]|nr:CHASE2 domain-containing protein [Pyrinomonadaceae bacterium]